MLRRCAPGSGSEVLEGAGPALKPGKGAAFRSACELSLQPFGVPLSVMDGTGDFFVQPALDENLVVRIGRQYRRGKGVGGMGAGVFL